MSIQLHNHHKKTRRASIHSHTLFVFSLQFSLWEVAGLAWCNDLTCNFCRPARVQRASVRRRTLPLLGFALIASLLSDRVSTTTSFRLVQPTWIVEFIPSLCTDPCLASFLFHFCGDYADNFVVSVYCVMYSLQVWLRCIRNRA